MPFDFTCLYCGGKMQISREHGKIQCTECGKFMDGTEPPTVEQSSAEAAPTETGESWQMGNLLYQGDMASWTRTLVSTLRTDLYRGDRKAALRTCERLLEMEREFLDAHMWIAKLHPDPDVQREHLETLLSLSPRNAEARRMLLVLKGDITQAESDRAADVYHDNTREATEAVESATEVLLCPLCRGTLTTNDDGSVQCAFCSYADDSAAHAVKPSKDTSLAVALIKQRGKAVRWQVGERMVHCHECGAERVLPRGKMSDRCPFCNSMHVVVEDVLGAFRQPDGLVKFKVNKPRALALIEAQLDSRVEKMKGWFIQNKVERIDLHGVFLPYWVFDIFGEVIIRDDYKDKNKYINTPNFERWEEIAQMHNVPVPAVKSPSKALLQQILPYDLSVHVPYTPKMLAKFAAELYTLDFDRASLAVRSVFRKGMIAKYPNVNPNATRTVTSQINDMEMQLLLLPAWVATLHEVDGDVRSAVVNGQTGELALGRARKPKGG